MFFADLSRPSKQLTGSVDGGSLGLALLLQKALDLLGFQQASDLVDAHLGPDRAVFPKHLRTQAGCGLSRREIGTVHTRLVDNNIVI